MEASNMMAAHFSIRFSHIDTCFGQNRVILTVSAPISVGLLCVQEFAQDRPTVSIVVSMLKSEIVDMPHPKKLAFTERQITDSSQRSQTKCFVNNVTVTMVQEVKLKNLELGELVFLPSLTQSHKIPQLPKLMKSLYKARSEKKVVTITVIIGMTISICANRLWKWILAKQREIDIPYAIASTEKNRLNHEC
ncbi:g-type lectin s-receptor-like serine/threonine-protein kinase [Quercus suber]|uniref:G-type lectin s-receptor-like serine/threonine-protein kinase n=1 Tax=Quercus suber TaxID=58331 RepID=A0AAW0KDH2_QUESU